MAFEFPFAQAALLACGRDRVSPKKSGPEITFNKITLCRESQKIPTSSPKLASPITLGPRYSPILSPTPRQHQPALVVAPCHVLQLAVAALEVRDQRVAGRHLGFGRMVASAVDVPNLFAVPV